MIQLNLLPDVKLEYIKAQRTRRVVVSISVLVTGVAVVILGLILAANGIQSKHLSDLDTDIKTSTAKLKSQPDIERVLTVQNQLESLSKLHADKPAASRTLSYLNQLTPSQVAISNFTIDFTQQAVTITGKADALSSVNKYVDTLKFTTYQTEGDKESKLKAFSSVVMTSFGLSSDTTDGKPATYTLTLTYDPVIFDITQDVTMNVPSRTTTRSELNNDSDLFEAAPAPSSSTTGGN